MGKKKQELGKGIKALLGNIEQKSEAVEPRHEGTSLVSLAQIESNPDQPRKEFDQDALRELAESIKNHGIIQPLTLRRLSSNAYQIIAGERRWRASKLAGLESVPAYIREANDSQMLEMALIENIQREDLNAMEVAFSYDRLIQECDYTQEELSERVGKKRSTVTNYLRLIKLPPVMQKSLKLGQIAMGHARVLAGIEDPLEQMQVFQKTLNGQLSVRQTEKLASNKTKPSTKKDVPGVLPEIKRIQERLSEKFGSQVKINRNSKGKGYITIPFGTDRHFNDILDNLDD